jgi:hypothetical protein
MNPPRPEEWGILRETSRNYLANSEQNEQMKKHPSVREIMNKLLKMFVFRKERGVEHRVIQNLRF